MTLRQSILDATLDQLPLRPLLTCDPNLSVRKALGPMRNRAVGCTLILDDAGKPVGMFNEKLLIRLLHQRPDALDEPIAEHMTQNVATLPESATIADLLATMRENQLRWIVVIDDEGRAVAITGVRGVMEFIVDHFPRVAMVQNLMCRLALPTREGA